MKEQFNVGDKVFFFKWDSNPRDRMIKAQVEIIEKNYPLYKLKDRASVIFYDVAECYISFFENNVLQKIAESMDQERYNLEGEKGVSKQVARDYFTRRAEGYYECIRINEENYIDWDALVRNTRRRYS